MSNPGSTDGRSRPRWISVYGAPAYDQAMVWVNENSAAIASRALNGMNGQALYELIRLPTPENDRSPIFSQSSLRALQTLAARLSNASTSYLQSRGGSLIEELDPPEQRTLDFWFFSGNRWRHFSDSLRFGLNATLRYGIYVYTNSPTWRNRYPNPIDGLCAIMRDPRFAQKLLEPGSITRRGAYPAEFGLIGEAMPTPPGETQPEIWKKDFKLDNQDPVVVVSETDNHPDYELTPGMKTRLDEELRRARNEKGEPESGGCPVAHADPNRAKKERAAGRTAQSGIEHGARLIAEALQQVRQLSLSSPEVKGMQI